MKFIEICILVIIVVMINSCKKEKLIDPIINTNNTDTIISGGYIDSSIWIINETIQVYQYNIENGNVISIDTTIENHTYNAIIKFSRDNNYISIINYEHYYPYSYDCTYNTYIDYLFTKKENNTYEYSSLASYFCSQPSLSYSLLTFDNPINPENFVSKGTSIQIPGDYAYNSFNMVGRKI